MKLIAGFRARSARLKAERETAQAKYRADAVRKNEAARIAGGTAQSIAGQIRAHPLNVVGLSVIVDGETVTTPSGTWLLRDTRATVSGGYSTRPAHYRPGLLAITGPRGKLYEKVLNTTGQAQAARMLTAHICARARAEATPRAR